ncbi:MAG TPA: helix-turn-helix domain-containing protein [Solirubrobacteraceae bacterium]|nr:helix-turn-helix domain-containing protein [Solirubrobacteraceae bacterium]
MATTITRPSSATTARGSRGEGALGGAGAGGNARPRSAGQARTRLLDAALNRFVAEGALSATLEDIRRDAGVSTGALYHHFPDKPALAAALYVELTAGFQEGFLGELRTHQGAEQGVRAGVRFYLRWVSANRDAAAFLLHERPAEDAALRALNRPFFAEVVAWWGTHRHYGALRELPFDVINALWLGPAQEYARHWIAGRGKRISGPVAEALADAAWLALRAEPDERKEPR